MSSTSAVSSTTDTSTTSTTSTTTESTLGQDAFLQLLITQMQNQDPMNPIEDQDFIAQLAQFSSLEQMTEISSMLETLTLYSAASQASSIVGRTVDYVDPSDSTNTLTGVVDSVGFEDGVPYLNIDSTDIEMAYVARIYAADETES